jgi:hypothetical protein
MEVCARIEDRSRASPDELPGNLVQTDILGQNGQKRSPDDKNRRLRVRDRTELRICGGD